MNGQMAVALGFKLAFYRSQRYYSDLGKVFIVSCFSFDNLFCDNSLFTTAENSYLEEVHT